MLIEPGAPNAEVESGVTRKPVDTDSQPLPPPDPAAGGSPPLSSAEVVLVKVLGYPSISGEYRINADDTISVPVIGRLSVTSMSIPNLERDLAARVLKRTGKEAYATVEVVKYKPVFVSGQVMKAGAYTWSPGMTVLHAETLSGGVYRPRQEGGAGLAVSLTLKNRTITDLKSALANHARLIAEKNGSEVVEVPERLEWLIGRTETRQIIDAQQRLLESRTSARKAQLSTLQQGLSVAESELAGLQQQVQMIDTQLSVRETFQAKLMRLRSEGLIPEERALEQQALVAQLQERKTNLSVNISRAEGSILNFKQELIKLEDVRKAEIETEIMNLERDIQKSEIDLETAREGERLLALENGNIGSSNVQMRETYTIIRREDSKTKKIDADKFTTVLPGDIVVVSIN